jgi:hypothetical protein
MQAETVGWVKSIHETRYGGLLGIVMVSPHVTRSHRGRSRRDRRGVDRRNGRGRNGGAPDALEAVKEAGLVALGRAIHLPNRKRATV